MLIQKDPTLQISDSSNSSAIKDYYELKEF